MSIRTEILKSIAAACQVDDETRLHTSARKTRMLLDPLANFTTNLAETSANLDKIANKILVLLGLANIVRSIESIGQPSPEPIFHAFQGLAHALEDIPDSQTRLEHCESDEVDHYSLKTEEGQLVRWTVNTIDDMRHLTIEIGNPNTARPTISAQHEPQSLVIDRHYFEEGASIEYSLQYTQPRHLQFHSLICQIRQYKALNDYNGTLLEPDQSIKDWTSDLLNSLPEEIKTRLPIQTN